MNVGNEYRMVNDRSLWNVIIVHDLVSGFGDNAMAQKK